MKYPDYDHVKEIMRTELPHILREDASIHTYLENFIKETMFPQIESLNQKIDEVKNMLERLQHKCEEHWAESKKRWDDNDRRWDKNDRRWDENDRRWDENDKKWDKNEARLIAIENKLSKIDGRTLEIEYRNKISSYFGLLLLRTKIIEVNHIVMNLRDYLSHSELKELFCLDILVRGKLWNSKKMILVAFEVSSVIDETDVNRAHRRSQLLRKAGFPAVGAVGGHDSAAGINEKAEKFNTVVLHNGSILFWDEALAELNRSGPHTFPSIKPS